MVKRAGERPRAPQLGSSYPFSSQFNSQPTASSTTSSRLTPEPSGKLDIASWAAAAAEALKLDGGATSPGPQAGYQAQSPAAGAERANPNRAAAPSEQQPQSKYLLAQQLYAQHAAQQQQQQYQAGLPNNRRAVGSESAHSHGSNAAAAAGGAAAAASRPPARHTPEPGPVSGVRAGTLSPIFAGGGMWSAIGRESDRDPAQLVSDYVNMHTTTSKRASTPPPAKSAGAATAGADQLGELRGRPLGASRHAADVFEPEQTPKHEQRDIHRSQIQGSSNSSNRPASLVPGGQGSVRSHHSMSTHSVLSSSSYQAAAAAAAAAVVAATAGNRGKSPGRGAMNDYEKHFVAAAAASAATAAASRATTSIETSPRLQGMMPGMMGSNWQAGGSHSRGPSPGRATHLSDLDSGLMPPIDPTMGVAGRSLSPLPNMPHPADLEARWGAKAAAAHNINSQLLPPAYMAHQSRVWTTAADGSKLTTLSAANLADFGGSLMTTGALGGRSYGVYVAGPPGRGVSNATAAMLAPGLVPATDLPQSDQQWAMMPPSQAQVMQMHSWQGPRGSGPPSDVPLTFRSVDAMNSAAAAAAAGGPAGAAPVKQQRHPADDLMQLQQEPYEREQDYRAGRRVTLSPEQCSYSSCSGSYARSSPSPEGHGYVPQQAMYNSTSSHRRGTSYRSSPDDGHTTAAPSTCPSSGRPSTASYSQDPQQQQQERREKQEKRRHRQKRIYGESSSLRADPPPAPAAAAAATAPMSIRTRPKNEALVAMVKPTEGEKSSNHPSNNKSSGKDARAVPAATAAPEAAASNSRATLGLEGNGLGIRYSSAPAKASGVGASGGAKYQAYPGQAALVYNPKTASKPGVSLYLRADKVASRQPSPPPAEQPTTDDESPLSSEASAPAEAKAAAAAPEAEATSAPQGPESGSEVDGEAAIAAAPADAETPSASAAQQQQQQQQQEEANKDKFKINWKESAAQRSTKQPQSSSGSSGATGDDNQPPGKAQVAIRVTAGPDDGSGSRKWWCCSKKVLCRVMLPLLLLALAAAGVGTGLALTQKKPAAGPAAPAAVASMFGVTAHPALPGTTSEQRCNLWFGTAEKQQEYQQVFTAAIAQALAVPQPDVQVLKIACDGMLILSQQPASSSGTHLRGVSSRHLLSARQATLPPTAAFNDLGLSRQQQPQQLPQATVGADTSDGVSQVLTQFVVSSTLQQPARAALASRLTSWSVNILTVPLSQFFKTSVWVQQAEQLEDWQSLATHASAASAEVAASVANAPQQQQLPAVGMIPQQPQVEQQPQSQQQPATMQVPAGSSSGIHSTSVAEPTTPQNVQQPAAAAPAPAAAVAVASVPSTSTFMVPAAPLTPAPGVGTGQAAPVEVSGGGATNAGAGGSPAAGKNARPHPPAPKPPAPPAQDAHKKAEPLDDEDIDYHAEPGEDVTSEDDTVEDDTSASGDTSDELDADEQPVEPPPPGSGSGSGLGSGGSNQNEQEADDSTQWVEFYDNAPTCAAVPTIVNSVYDGSGRLWGWEKKATCVFRATSPQWAPVTWKEAKPCSGAPTPHNSVYDESGKLWGWQDGRNCAFKGDIQKPAALMWKTAPDCEGKASGSNSVTDMNGRKWGWVDGKICAFRKGGKP